MGQDAAFEHLSHEDHHKKIHNDRLHIVDLFDSLINYFSFLFDLVGVRIVQESREA